MKPCNYEYAFLNPHKLIATEEINEEEAIKLTDSILSCGSWKTPVSVHKDALFVMDGHHRLNIARRLNLKLMPVVLLDYDSVDVCAWRDGEIITPDIIIEMVRKGKKFPFKTTKHSFRQPIKACNVPLYELMTQ